MHDLGFDSTDSTDVLVHLGKGQLRLQLVTSRSLLLIEQRVVPLTPTEYRLLVPLIRQAPYLPVTETAQKGPLLSCPGTAPQRLQLLLPRCVHRTTLQRVAQLKRSASVIEHLSRAARKLEVWGITVARSETGFCLCSSLSWQEAEEGAESLRE